MSQLRGVFDIELSDEQCAELDKQPSSANCDFFQVTLSDNPNDWSASGVLEWLTGLSEMLHGRSVARVSAPKRFRQRDTTYYMLDLWLWKDGHGPCRT